MNILSIKMSDFVSLLISSLIQLALFSLIPFIWWLFTSRNTNFFQWIGLKKPLFNSSVYKTFSIIIVVSILYIISMYFIMSNLMDGALTATSQFTGKGIRALPSILIYAIVQTGLSEELFFRGFLCKRLIKRYGFTLGNLLQSLFFGLVHGIPFGLATGNLLVCGLLILLPGSIGYIQGWLNERKSNGSIIPSWTLHALMNTLSALTSI